MRRRVKARSQEERIETMRVGIARIEALLARGYNQPGLQEFAAAMRIIIAGYENPDLPEHLGKTRH